MFAVINLAGFQYKVQKNTIVTVPRLNLKVGSEISIEEVLMAGDQTTTVLDQLSAIKVKAVVLEHVKSPKKIIFKKKCRKNYVRTQGYRQSLTRLLMTEVGFEPTAHGL